MSPISDSDVAEIMDIMYEEYDSPAAQALLDEIDIDHLAERLEGRSGGLRVSKPQASGDTGLTQYVWRMARFYSGNDPKMPVMATSWLESWLSDQDDIDASVWGVKSDAEEANGEVVKEILEHVTTLVLLKFGKDPAGGAKRWAPLLGL